MKINKSIKRIILEYTIDNLISLFIDIDDIPTMSWYINVLKISRIRLIKIRGFQYSYFHNHLKVALWLNKIFNLTAKDRILHNPLFRKYNYDPLSRVNRNRKGRRRLIKILHEYRDFLTDHNIPYIP